MCISYKTLEIIIFLKIPFKRMIENTEIKSNIKCLRPKRKKYNFFKTLKRPKLMDSHIMFINKLNIVKIPILFT